MPSDSLCFVQSNAERTPIPRSVKKKEKSPSPSHSFFPSFLFLAVSEVFLSFFELFLFCFVVGVVLWEFFFLSCYLLHVCLSFMFFFDLFPPFFMLRTILSSSSLLATYVPSTFSLPPSLRPSLHLMDFFSPGDSFLIPFCWRTCCFYWAWDICLWANMTGFFVPSLFFFFFPDH